MAAAVVVVVVVMLVVAGWGEVGAGGRWACRPFTDKFVVMTVGGEL